MILMRRKLIEDFKWNITDCITTKLYEMWISHFEKTYWDTKAHYWSFWRGYAYAISSRIWRRGEVGKYLFCIIDAAVCAQRHQGFPIAKFNSWEVARFYQISRSILQSLYPISHYIIAKQHIRILNSLVVTKFLRVHLNLCTKTGHCSQRILCNKFLSSVNGYFLQQFTSQKHSAFLRY